MISGRRATDWLAGPSSSPEDASDRRGRERRANDRRAPKRQFDPLFAATLVNQIAPPETEYVRGYETAAPRVRTGLVVNRRA